MNTLKKAWVTVLSGGGGYQLTAPTEAELLAYIMANFPPDFFLDPEQGIVDSSGNGVTVTTNGSPSVTPTGGLNNRAYIPLNGSDQAVIVDRVDIGTHAFVFRHNNTSQMLLNVPTSNTGTGDGPKFFKQGFQWNNSGGYYAHLPDSGGTKKGVRTHLATAASWRNFLCRGEGYSYNNGRSVFNVKLTAVADTSVTKMFYGCWGRGDGANLANFTAYDLGLSMIWSAELTDEQMYIVHAYLEARFNSYGALTYQSKPATLEIEASNPIFNGNSFSESTQDQAYAGGVLPEGAAIFKGLSKDLFGFSSVDPNLLTWTDEDVVLAAGGFGAFDENGINICVPFKIGATYYLIYGGRNSTSQYQIGYATSNSPLTGYTKYESNPIVTLSAINVSLTKSYTLLYPNALAVIDGTYYLFLNALQSGVNACDIVVVSGASLNSLGNAAIILTQADSPVKDRLLYGTGTTRDDTNLPEYSTYCTLTGLHRFAGKFIAQFSVSNIFGDALVNARSAVVFSAISDTIDSGWKTIGSGVLIDTGAAGTWNRTQSYLGGMIVDQDGEFLTPFVNPSGKWIIPFAGLGTTADAINTHGMTGYAYAPNKRIVENLL
ncbi:MAG TPA: hypothetical protein PKN99_03070 [Cyclobacteriaceae bacterium]|nr:hypothetical protein [Cyclobacteriaceae bacterium]